jgi:hypothetical protein
MVARLRILTATALVTAWSVSAAPALVDERPDGARPRAARSSNGAEPTSQAGVVSQQADTPREGEGTQAPSPGPMEVFDDIERGWNARNVDLILKHFGSQKVAISIDGTGPSGGSFSKSQSYYLLKDHFRFTVTKRFEFVQFRKASDEGTESFAIAQRYYQRRDDGRLIKDKVYVSLHLDRDRGGERWVVDEIKSIR